MQKITTPIKILAIGEAAVLCCGGASCLWFLLYSEDMFNPLGWTPLDVEELVPIGCIILFPYIIWGAGFWLFRRYAVLYLLSSIVMALLAFHAYYSAFFHSAQQDEGWVFLIIPFLQLLFLCVVSAIFYLFGKIVAMMGRRHAK